MILTLIVLWFLLQPGDGWGWMIIGGYETRQECEAARERHPLGHWLICARNERNRLGAPPAPRVVSDSGEVPDASLRRCRTTTTA